MLTGAIAPLGSEYVITLEAINAATGDSLRRCRSSHEQGAGVECSGFGRRQAARPPGESMASVQKFDKPLQEVTTSSLEALKAFTQADELRERGDALPPVALYKHAIELDPNLPWRMPLGQPVLDRWPGGPCPPELSKGVRIERARQRAGKILHH